MFLTITTEVGKERTSSLTEEVRPYLVHDRKPYRRPLAGWLLGFVLAAWPALGFSAEPGTEKVGSLRDLPLAAQFAISAAFGRETAAYHVVAARDLGFSAANPAQGYAAELTAQGFTVSAGEMRWGLSLEAWGCGGKVESLPPAVPEARANRVELRRGAVLEWYENGPMGLQQGFTLEKAPRGCGSGEAVRLVLTPVGNLSLEVEEGGKGLAVGGSGGAALHYGGLAAFEAGGREVPARLDLRDGRVVLEVSAGARYPLVLDPFVQLAKLTASDGANLDLFGHSVAISGATVVVGAYNSMGVKGSAYVFVEPVGGWAGALTQTAKLTASDGAAGNAFGTWVAISGDTVVVGAPFADIGTHPDQGAAYVFVKPTGGWAGTLTQTAKLTASDGAANDQLGGSVAIAGDTVVAGALAQNSAQGAAYVFVKPGGGWAGAPTQAAKLIASDGAITEKFGSSVAIAGDTVVVGAPSAKIGVNVRQGAAYVFVKPVGGWAGRLNQTAKLTASDGAADDALGSSIAIDGNTVVAGAVTKKIGVNDLQGAAYVFVKPAGGWAGVLTQNTKLTAWDGAAADEFGESVALSGDTLVVGGSLSDIGGKRDQGSAYVFRVCCACTARIGVQ